MAKNVDKSRESTNIINVTLAIINSIIAIIIINVIKDANTFITINIKSEVTTNYLAKLTL